MAEEEYVPKAVGPYVILGKVGAGAFASAVYRAQHTTTMTIVALKSIPKRNLRNPSEFELLQREVNLMKGMDHPFIAALFEVLDDDKNYYLAMEFVENGNLLFTRNEKDMKEFCQECKIGFAKPDVWNIEVPYAKTGAEHKLVTQNFVNAILNGETLIAPASEGIYSVELANSILYSSLIGEMVELPLDSSAYEAKLKELIEHSTHVKKVREVVTEDFSKSFSQ